MKLQHALTIDNGNSSPDVALFKAGVLTEVIRLDDFSNLSEEWSGCPMALSQVSSDLKLPAQIRKKGIRFTRYRQDNFFFEMPVFYSETIGEDRLYQSYYLYQEIKNTNRRIMLIDAGTFTTIDLLTSDGLEGGYIYPGDQSFLNIYPQFASHLPQLKPPAWKPSSDYPHNTKDAILESLKLSLVGLYQKITEQFRPTEVIFSGGLANRHHQLFSQSFDYPIKCHNHLIHQSLYYLLEKHYEKFKGRAQ